MVTSYDPNKTQIFVSVFDGGYGTEWIKKAAKEFNEGLDDYEVIIQPSKSEEGNILSTFQSGYPSAAVTVKKHAAPAKPSVTEDNKINFTAEAGVTYELYYMGEYQGTIEPGDDISVYFEAGHNEFGLRAAKSENVLKSDLSEEVDIICHPEITDFSVNETGTVTFSSYENFSYDIVLKSDAGDSEVKADVSNGEDLTGELDALAVGESRLVVKLKAAHADARVISGTEESNVYTVSKLAKVENVSAEGVLLSFTEQENAKSYEYFLDGVSQGMIESGANFTAKIPVQENKNSVEVKVRALGGVADGKLYWRGETSDPYTYHFDGYASDLFTSEMEVSLQNDYFINEAVQGTGITFIGGDGAVFRSETFDLLHWNKDQSLLTLHPTAVNDEYNVQELYIRIVNASDSSNYIEWKLYRQNLDLKTDIRYFTKDNAEGTTLLTAADTNWKGYSVFNKIAGAGNYDVDKFLSLYFDPATGTVTDGLTNEPVLKGSADFSNFKNGAYLEVEIGAEAGKQCAVTVKDIFGVDTSNSVIERSVAATEISVDAEGVLHFTANESGAAHWIVVNGEYKIEVHDGDNIAGLLAVSENTLQLVSVCSGKANGVSEPITVSKTAVPSTPVLSGTVITFTEEAGNTYHLYVNEEYKAEVKSGDDVAQYLISGVNRIALRAIGGAGSVQSELSQSVVYVNGVEVTDFAVTADGKLSFTDIAELMPEAGITYDLLKADGAVLKANVANAEDISAILDGLEGEETIRLRINIPDQAAAESNAYTISKLGDVANLKFNGVNVTFDEVDGATAYELYLDDTLQGTIVSGESFTASMVAKAENTVEVAIRAIGGVADGKLYWRGSMDTAARATYTHRGYISEFFEATSAEYQNAFTINASLNGTGAAFTGVNGDVLFKTKTFDFANWDNTRPMITLHPTAVNGEYNVSAMSINIVDVSDSSNYIEWKLYRAGTNLRAFAKYYSASNPEGMDVLQDSDANWRGYSLFDYIAGGSQGADKFMSLWYDPATKSLNDGSIDFGGTVNFEGFESGAYIEVRIETYEGKQGAVTVTSLFGESTAYTVLAPYLANDLFAANDSGVTVISEGSSYTKFTDNGTGTLIQTSGASSVQIKEVYDIKNAVASTPVIEMQFVSVGDVYGLSSFTVVLTDKDNAENQIRMTLSVSGATDMRLDFSYGAHSDWKDANWAGYSLKAMGGEEVMKPTLGIRFVWIGLRLPFRMGLQIGA